MVQHSVGRELTEQCVMDSILYMEAGSGHSGACLLSMGPCCHCWSGNKCGGWIDDTLCAKRKVFREQEEMVRLEEKENVDKEEKVFFCVQSLFKFQFNIESPA